MTAMVLAGLFAAVTLAAATLSVVTRNLVHAVLWLALALLGTAGLYATEGADFLAGVQVLAYVGGVVTLLVFGVMVTRRHESLAVPAESGDRGRALLASMGLFGLLAYAIVRSDFGSLREVEAPAVREIGALLLGRYVIAFEAASVLLLAAMVGAAVIARRREPGVTPEEAGR